MNSSHFGSGRVFRLIDLCVEGDRLCRISVSMYVLMILSGIMGARAGLLGQAKAALELVPSHFTDKINASKQVWAIVYYASWCPHCQHYCPEFDKLASEFKGDERVQFGGVDCAAYAQYCALRAIRSYPTLRFYHLWADYDSETPVGASIERDKYTPEKLKHWLTERLSAINWTARFLGQEPVAATSTASTTTLSTPQPLPTGFGQLKTMKPSFSMCLGVKVPEGAWRPTAVMTSCHSESRETGVATWYFHGASLRSSFSRRDTEKYSCLLYDVEDDKLFATSVCIDTAATQQWYIEGQRVKSFVDHKCLAVDEVGTNVFLASCADVDEQKWKFELLSATSTTMDLSESVRRKFASRKASTAKGATASVPANKTAVAHASDVTSLSKATDEDGLPSLHMADSEVVLVYSIHQGLALAPVQTGPEGLPFYDEDTISELSSWLEVIVEVHPSPRLVAYAKHLAKYISMQMQKDGFVEKSMLLQAVNQQQVVPPPAVSDPSPYWRSCKTYTCGLWSLFHILSIAVAERRSAPLTERFLGLSTRLSPAQFLLRVHGFVSRFFGCSECVSNFLKTWDSCRFGRCSLSANDGPGAALWLWQVHNEVTLRTARENGLGSASPWPSRDECASCWQSSADDIDYSSWDAAAVYEHMKRTYWHDVWEPGGQEESVSPDVDETFDL